jgi:hypothetical protein
LIFNMVSYSLIHNSRISSDRLERPNLFAGLAITTWGFQCELTAFTFVYRVAPTASRPSSERATSESGGGAQSCACAIEPTGFSITPNVHLGSQSCRCPCQFFTNDWSLNEL